MYVASRMQFIFCYIYILLYFDFIIFGEALGVESPHGEAICKKYPYTASVRPDVQPLASHRVKQFNIPNKRGFRIEKLKIWRFEERSFQSFKVSSFKLPNSKFSKFKVSQFQVFNFEASKLHVCENSRLQRLKFQSLGSLCKTYPAVVGQRSSRVRMLMLAPLALMTFHFPHSLSPYLGW